MNASLKSLIDAAAGSLAAPIVIATQEPYGTYHLECLKDLIPNMVHLQPGEVQGGHGITVSNDYSILDTAALLIITGGLLSNECAKAALYAKRAGKKVVFLELAYPQLSGTKPVVIPDIVIATTDGGFATYKDYFGTSVEMLQELHPALRNLPSLATEVKPSLLIGSTVSAESPDHGLGLLQLAQELSLYSEFNVRVRLHPRENRLLWTGLNITTGTTLAEDLSISRAFVSYQTTAFLTANAMGVPCFHLATEKWMEGRTPDGFAISEPVFVMEQFIADVKRLLVK